MLGLNEYETPRDLYHRKRGELPPVEETLPMRMGKKLEPVIIETYCEDHGIDMADVAYPAPAYLADDERFIATPDAILSRSDTWQGRIGNWSELIEAKSTTSFAAMWRAATRSEVPDTIYCQAQWQMLCTQLEICHVAILCDGRTMRCFDVARDDAVISMCASAAEEFLARIANGDAPDWDVSHPAYADSVKRVFSTITGERLILPLDVAGKWFRREELAEQRKAIEKEEEALKADVLAAMGTAEAGVLGDGRIVKRSQRDAVLVESFTRKAYIDFRATKDPMKR